MNAEIVIAFSIFLSMLGGVLMARRLAGRRQRLLLKERLANWSLDEKHEAAPSLIRRTPPKNRFSAAMPAMQPVTTLITQSGVDIGASNFLMLCAILLLTPCLVALWLALNIAISLLIGVALSALPFAYLLLRRSRLRSKFAEQLPDAIDLMVSVLRSGHSIPQAVKAVAAEVPAPCGREFAEVLHRMHVGQALSEALIYSTDKFHSFELDLIRRAVAIQSEVGGSLAELLDKTNSTLRQRLKLVRQVGVLTAQSRLTALIVGCLPIILAFALNFINPGYLSPLVQSFFGQTLLAVAIVLQIAGLFLMKKMSTVKI